MHVGDWFVLGACFSDELFGIGGHDLPEVFFLAAVCVLVLGVAGQSGMVGIGAQCQSHTHGAWVGGALATISQQHEPRPASVGSGILSGSVPKMGQPLRSTSGGNAASNGPMAPHP